MRNPRSKMMSISKEKTNLANTNYDSIHLLTALSLFLVINKNEQIKNTAFCLYFANRAHRFCLTMQQFRSNSVRLNYWHFSASVDLSTELLVSVDSSLGPRWYRRHPRRKLNLRRRNRNRLSYHWWRPSQPLKSTKRCWGANLRAYHTDWWVDRAQV